VTVTASAHGLGAGLYVHFQDATAAAGLTITGQYFVISTPTADTFTITASGTASSWTTGGGSL
jgi:hypothetical protein